MLIEQITTKHISNLIYNIRGMQVIFDFDVAKLYGYETKRINEAVSRNKSRFPERFCFKLTEKEFETLKSQYVSLKYTKSRYLPNVFTEQGIAMLSSVLRNKIAVSVSINIMDAFAGMRKFILSNNQMLEKIMDLELKLLEHDKKFDEIFNKIQTQNNKEFTQKIFYNGQIYDAYSLIIDIIEGAENEIAIIDNYIDRTVLKMLTKKKINVNVKLITCANCSLNKIDKSKFNMQYPHLKIYINKNFHDRFIIIDNKEIYHIGASLKDLGKKCFAISKMNDDSFIEKYKKEIL